jgi:hypothetical protein
MDDLERRLQKWGADWRSSEAPYSDSRVTEWRARRMPLVAVAQLMGSVSAIAIIGGVFVFGLWIHGGAIGAPAASQVGPTVADGDRVSASGYLVQTDGDTLMACMPASSRLVLPVYCSAVHVPVTGLDPTTLSQWRAQSGGGYAAGVTVEGIWSRGVLHAERAYATATEDPLPVCDEVVGAAPPDSLTQEAAMQALDAEVSGSRSIYSGTWPATDSRGDDVTAVGVIHPRAAEAASNLAKIYPFRLCVVPVDFARDSLDARVTDLAASHPDWLPTLDIPRDRVDIFVPVLDGPTASALGSVGSDIWVNALVQLR